MLRLAGMAMVSGFERDEGGALALGSVAVEMRNGFLVDSDGALVVSGAAAVAGGSRQFVGPEASVRPLIAALPAGTEFSWTKTDGAGVLLDLVTGVA